MVLRGSYDSRNLAKVRYEPRFAKARQGSLRFSKVRARYAEVLAKGLLKFAQVRNISERLAKVR